MRTFFAVVLLNLALFAGIYQRSLAEYFELKYHVLLPEAGANLRALAALEPRNLPEIFARRGAAGGAVGGTGGTGGTGGAASSPAAQTTPEQRKSFTAHKSRQAALNAQAAAISAATGGLVFTCREPRLIASNRLQVAKNAGVLLLGDSLMEGIAQRLCRHLRARGVPCRSLAKQSSGLIHQRFYDYALVLRDELARHPGAAAIVLAGVNDLYDAYFHGEKLAFGSDEWLGFYEQRLAALSQAAAFVALPALRGDKGAERARWFNAAVAPLVRKMGARWLELGGDEGFSYYSRDGRKLKRLRAHDGVHFTPAGYEKMAAALLALLDIR